MLIAHKSIVHILLFVYIFLDLSKLMFAKEHFIVHKYEERKIVNKQIQRNLKANFENDAEVWN